jgi:hypothetical protein
MFNIIMDYLSEQGGDGCADHVGGWSFRTLTNAPELLLFQQLIQAPVADSVGRYAASFAPTPRIA